MRENHRTLTTEYNGNICDAVKAIKLHQQRVVSCPIRLM